MSCKSGPKEKAIGSFATWEMSWEEDRWTLVVVGSLRIVPTKDGCRFFFQMGHRPVFGRSTRGVRKNKGCIGRWWKDRRFEVKHYSKIQENRNEREREREKKGKSEPTQERSFTLNREKTYVEEKAKFGDDGNFHAWEKMAVLVVRKRRLIPSNGSIVLS